MATYVEINGNQYPAVITGRLNDKDWGNRESKAIKVEMAYADVLAMFVNDIDWNIVQDVETYRDVEDEEGNVISTEMVMEQEVYDNSDYCIAGPIVDHRDGYVTVKMGKPTAAELLAMLEEVL
ncbi:MAG: hypothetical protein IJ444_02050 [Kiritimatiellae bacterium]|nr:hypothetical protein [Kiritimatiellia bacterium]